MVEAMGVPPWDHPTWLFGVLGVACIAAAVVLERKQAARLEAEQARQERAAQVRLLEHGEAMSRTGQHPVARPVSRPAPSLLAADQRQLVATIRSLQTRLDAAEQELRIRQPPDPILRVLLIRPLSADQLALTLGDDLADVQERLARLTHITEQVVRVREGRDTKYALAGPRSARTESRLPARGGKAG